MVDLPFSRRLLLRCDLVFDGLRSVCHTVQISEDAAFIWTSRQASPGDRVSLNLSFPGLLEPLALEAAVTERFAALDPGDPEGLLIDFQPHQSGAKALGAFLQGIDDRLGKSEPGTTEREYRLLFIEDSDLMCQMFKLGAKRFFRKSPVSVDIDVAQTAEDAWELLRTGEYSMAVVDFFLPGRLGSELIRDVRATPALEAMTCIGVSVGGDEAREAFLHAGADMYLDKPMVLQDLFATLEVLGAQREA